jgi:hypothetical protein
MSSWWLADGLVELREQINARWPTRDHASDGSIGDPAHQADPTSDHNPDSTSSPPGAVRAIDIDSDLEAGDPRAIDRLFEEIRQAAAARRDGGRTYYLILKRRIASGNPAYQPVWAWRPYTGSDPHTSHGHISALPAADHDASPWRLPILEEGTDVTPAELKAAIREVVWDHKVADAAGDPITYDQAVDRWNRTRSTPRIAEAASRATVKALKTSGLLAADVDEEAVAAAVAADLAARLTD